MVTRWRIVVEQKDGNFTVVQTEKPIENVAQAEREINRQKLKGTVHVVKIHATYLAEEVPVPQHQVKRLDADEPGG